MNDKIDVLAVIDSLQFGFNHRRCPMCAGWNVGPNGETDKMHTDTCPVPKARAAIAEVIEACRAYDDLRDRLFLLMMADPRRENLLKQVDEADKRRRAALANVGGA